MAYPTIYSVTYSYTGFQQSQGNNAFPGTQIDSDLAGLEDSIANLATFVERTIRSDNALNNGVVTADSLAPSLLTSGIAPASAWATATDYPKSATVIQGGKLYRSTVEHVSGVFATDLAAGKWVFVADLVTAGKPIVILFDGQSNPEQILTFPWSPNPNATFWNGGREGVLGTAFAPLSATTIQLPAKFASDVADANPLRPVYVIAILQSGTAISHWIVGSGTGAPFVFQTALDNVTAALAAIGATKIDVYARWQGESDASPLNTSMIANLETLMTQYRAQSWFPRETPVIIFGIASTATSGVTEYDQMNGLFQGFVNADPDNRKFVYPATLDSSYWDGTHIHMTAQGYFSVGAMAAREYLNGGRANAPGVTANPATKNVAVGTPGSKSAAPFAINANASPLMPTFAGGIVSQKTGADGFDALDWTDTFAGTGGELVRRANGTKAAPTALTANNLIAFWGGRGYDGSAYSGAAVGLNMYAAEAWSGTAHGTYASIFNTISGTTVLAETVRFKSGSVTINGVTSGGVALSASSTGSALSVTPSAISPAAPTVASSPFRVQALDGAAGGQEWQTYLNGLTFTGNILAGAVAGGTAAAPTGPPNGSYMFNMRGYAYNSGWQNASLILMRTAEAWSAGHQGTATDFYTTPIASTAIALAMSITPSGGVTVASANDYGNGNLAAPVGGLTTAPSTTKTANYTMTTADSTIIFNGAGSLTLTLLAAASYPGRWLTIKTIAAQTVVSAGSNVVPQVGGAAGTAILAATAGKWAMLQSDGANWVVMASN